MKYFISSDIHSFYTPFKNALDNAGYDKENPEHTLIIVGDVFDRGDETLELYHFLRSIPEKNLILIKGNHEYLYEKLLTKSFPDRYDFSNGTVKTFCHIAKVNPLKMETGYYYNKYINDKKKMYEEIEKIPNVWKEIVEKVRNSRVTKWINSKRWKHYYELDKFIFTHSFIPVELKEGPEYKWLQCWPTYQIPSYDLQPIKDWRKCHSELSWEEATWGCPYKYFDSGLFDEEKLNGKVLVCGHWHASDFHTRYEKEYGENFDLYYGKNLIALDACTAYSKKCNVLVIENNECYFENKKLQVTRIIETFTVKEGK